MTNNTTNGMSAEEIKKTLECCTRLGCSDNETADCPLKAFEDCSTRLATNTLAYVTYLEESGEQQKAEIERLKKVQRKQGVTIADMRGNVYELIDTIDNLKKCSEFQADNIRECLDTIERKVIEMMNEDSKDKRVELKFDIQGEIEAVSLLLGKTKS